MHYVKDTLWTLDNTPAKLTWELSNYYNIVKNAIQLQVKFRNSLCL